MTADFDLTPLSIWREGGLVTFRLKGPEEVALELPAEFETLLQNRLQDILRDAEQLAVQIDLAQVPAISSRQLGALLALRKVLCTRFKHVPLEGVSREVRHVLALTRTDQLFDLK